MDVAELHKRAVEEFVARLDAVGERWHGPTPCPVWDVRELVNHVVVEDLWTPPMMQGATIDDVGNKYDGDVLGDDPLGVAKAAAEAAVSATAEGLSRGQVVHLSFGDTPAEEYAYQLAADHVVHGWDLAVATGGDAEMDPDLVEALAVWFADREELYRSAGAIGARPDDQPSTDPQDMLLAAFGRRSTWSC